MASTQSLELRVTALEARVTDIEDHFSGQLHSLRRESAATRLNLAKIMQHLGLPRATEDEIDEVLDTE
ncbi:hypothetical protein SMC26_03175 [Actinomadura fulvescens]|uniref:Uncharacterized protein n=1 Tax=Actinomadura fulvescens TaxID=46160 RepID=A0ABN3PUE3_9ACTN